MLEYPKDFTALTEQLRSAHEGQLEARLKHSEACRLLEVERGYAIAERMHFEEGQVRLKQAVTSLRWWVVFSLVWLIREVSEPARFALFFPTSWTYKIATVSGYPAGFANNFVALWFTTSAVLILPLVLALALTPNSKLCRQAEAITTFGLFMGGVGFAALTSASARLEIPHVVDSFKGSTVMLIGAGLLVSCWHNTRTIRSEAAAAKLTKDASCNVAAL